MGKKVRQRVQLELDRFLDPRWIVFGTPPEAFQKSERSKAIQLDRAWIAFWIVFWIACWIAAGTATLTSTN